MTAKDLVIEYEDKDVARFWSKVDRTLGAMECWEWKSTKRYADLECSKGARMGEKVTTKEMVLYYAKQWEGKYGARLQISWGKDTAQFKRLLATYSADELVLFIDHYFTDFVSSFSVRAGHSIGAFIGQLPAIIASYQQEQEKRRQVEDTNYARLEAARKES